MAKKKRTKITTVREHPRRVGVSKKNPEGITVVDRHSRRVEGSFLDRDEILKIEKNHDRSKIVYPTSGKLSKYKNADKYDNLIAVWTDYFNEKFYADPKLDPDVVKALIASESGFREDPKNPIAIGLTQITKQTLKILIDPEGEAKDFVFNNIRQKVLKNPSIAIPLLAVRWLFRKKATAQSKLKRSPSAEEIILEYKGLLRSKTDYKNTALKNFREDYAELKKK